MGFGIAGMSYDQLNQSDANKKTAVSNYSKQLVKKLALLGFPDACRAASTLQEGTPHQTHHG